MRSYFRAIPGCRIYRQEPIARHTSFRIGGPARYFVIVRSLRALKQVLGMCRNARTRFFILGAGTNILCSDQGFNGLVIRLKGHFLRIVADGNRFTCGAGAMLDTMLVTACARGYGGAEFLAGIPGTVGGAVYCNAGAFGHAIGDIIERIEILTPHGNVSNLCREEIRFEYRKSGLPRRAIILSAILHLKKKRAAIIRQQLRDIRKYRHGHQPKGYSAGSFFKNPHPHAAGRLIDECGMKGMVVGDAVVSTQHANWIINQGMATAHDVRRLASIIKKEVRKQTGIELQEEVRTLK